MEWIKIIAFILRLITEGLDKEDASHFGISVRSLKDKMWYVMVKPKPFRYTCNICQWSKIVTPASDVLTPLEFFDCCPKCGNLELKTTKVSPFIAFMYGINSGFIKQRWIVIE